MSTALVPNAYQGGRSKLQAELMDTFIRDLYKPLERVFTRRIDAIIEQNDALAGETQNTFVFDFQRYSHSCVSRAPRTRPILDPKLTGKFRELLAERKHFDSEKRAVRRYVRRAMDWADSIDDFQCVVPDMLDGIFREWHQDQSLVTNSFFCFSGRTKSDLQAEHFKTEHLKGYQLLCARVSQNTVLR